MSAQVKMTLCETVEEFDAAGAGAIYPWRYGEKLTQGYIMVKCPGCGDESAMHVRDPKYPHPTEPTASWTIEGYPDAITLKPSINCVGCCGWHAYLTNGVFG